MLDVPREAFLVAIDPDPDGCGGIGDAAAPMVTDVPPSLLSENQTVPTTLGRCIPGSLMVHSTAHLQHEALNYR